MFTNKDDYWKIIAINTIILSTIAVAYLLNVGSSLILPFIISILMSFWIISAAGFFKKLGLNKFLSYFLSFIIFFMFFFIVGLIINNNVNEMTTPSKIKFYEDRLNELSVPVLEYVSKFNINQEELQQKIFKSINFTWLFGSITGALANIVSYTWLIIIYILFILLEYRFFKDKIDLMSNNPLKRSRINWIILKIKNDVKAYFVIKAITSVLTGVFSYIVMVLFEVHFPLFWAFSIFILNFIPTVWSIIWVWIVSIFSILQFWFTLWLGMLILILIGIQMLIWNFIEPKLMWSKLNLSPLVILLSLWLWGAIWGVVGMLLSVPIMVIINIVLSKFDSTKPISILLSEKWVINWEEITIEQTKRKFRKLFKNNVK